MVEDFEYSSTNSSEEEQAENKMAHRVAQQISNKENQWKGNILTVNRPEFLGLPETNSNLYLLHASPIDVVHLFFNNEISELIQTETNLYVKIKLSLCLTKHHAKKTYWGLEV
jgi:hypothetical protein